MKKATLILSDGSRFCGESFGYEKSVTGEVVFNTAMSGYPESLTDPSYAGQLMTLTYPLVGNYGVPPFTKAANGLPHFMESERIHAEAIIVSDYSEVFSHWNAVESLADWLKREQIPGITGIDTRRLTKVLREHGVMMGRIEIDGVSDEPIATNEPAYGEINYVDRVSCKAIHLYAGEEAETLALNTPTEELNAAIDRFEASLPAAVASSADTAPRTAGSLKRVVLVDCGVKANILRCLIRRGVLVIRVPWNYDFNPLHKDALFISNGPGDPNLCNATVENVKEYMKLGRPIYGICMGNQILSLAAGAKVEKLKYGHRGHNQPVRLMKDGKPTEQCFITSQNHGYAVNNDTIPEDWEPLFINMNDGSNEGIRHKTMPWFSAQFHPEACSGPTDTEFIFGQFFSLL